MSDYVRELRAIIGNRPFIMVGAAVIVMNSKEEVLLQLRQDTKEWGLPGGAMEPGETIEQTARRELFEETGLTCESLRFINVFSGPELYFQYPNGDEVHNVTHLYYTKRVSGTLTLQKREGIDLQYFATEKLPKQLDRRAQLMLEQFSAKLQSGEGH